VVISFSKNPSPVSSFPSNASMISDSFIYSIIP
jgi:hypothetical protein